MAIYKANVCNQFTQVPNDTLQDSSITFEAKGLLVMILSLPSNWEIHKEWLQKQSPKCGRDKLTRLIKELTDSGYMIKKPRRSEDGKTLAGYDWFVYPVNQLQANKINASSGILKTSRPDNQAVGKPATTNKHINKETSKSVNSTQTENFSNKVITELLSDNLPESKLRYAQLKIKEYEDRFPQSESVADCWSYVVQAINHQSNLTG